MVIAIARSTWSVVRLRVCVTFFFFFFLTALPTRRLSRPLQIDSPTIKKIFIITCPYTNMNYGQLQKEKQQQQQVQ